MQIGTIRIFCKEQVDIKIADENVSRYDYVVPSNVKFHNLKFKLFSASLSIGEAYVKSSMKSFLQDYERLGGAENGDQIFFITNPNDSNVGVIGLSKTYGLKNSFDITQQPRPKFTGYLKDVRDRVLIRLDKNSNLEIVDSFLYYAPPTAFLPVIIDIREKVVKKVQIDQLGDK